MEPKTSPSTPVSDSGYPLYQGIGITTVSVQNLYDDLEPNAWQVRRNLDCSSTQPGHIRRDVHGTYNDTMEARASWLQCTASWIRSDLQPEVKQALRDCARSNGLHEKLDRAILVHDISTSTAPVREKLTENLVFLYLNLEMGHNSDCPKSYQKMLLKGLQPFLLSPIPPKRTKRDEAQITSLVRALLELSGGTVDLRQHKFDEEYTASEHADLYASVLNIVRTKKFGDFDSKEMCNTLSTSPVFSRKIISIKDLEERTTKMMDSLRLGFREGHLNLPSQVLSGFGFGQVDMFRVYLANTFLHFPTLSNPENDVSLLLTWSTMISSRQLGVLSDWARSADGWSLYTQLVQAFQGPQSVEQLALTMTALMNYRRLSPNLPTHSDQPIESIYLADLEHTIFALIRVLYSSVDQFKDLIMFLEIALDREPTLLHVVDAFLDQYLRQRMKGQSHKTAIAEIAPVKMPQLREDDDADWVNVMYPEDLSVQGLRLGEAEYGGRVRVASSCTGDSLRPVTRVSSSSRDHPYD